MRTTKIKLLGKEYTLCCSTRCMLAMEERSGSFSQFLDDLIKGKVSDKMFALEQMLRAGYVHDTREGKDPLEPPKMDDVYNCTCVDDYPEINKAIFEAITEGTKRKVEAKSSKKDSGATQAE